MTAKIYLRPTAFIDAPFGLDGRVARLAGGMQFFAAVEILRDGGSELWPVEGFEARLADLGEPAASAWANIIAPRPPLNLGQRVIRLDQPQVAGIVNVTPDSFSGDGRAADPEAAIEAGFAMSAAGAALIDVGGESTRPGAKPVWEGDEASGAAVSIDTRKAMVMEQALAAGANMVNDVSALTWDKRAAEIVAKAGCPVVLMHHQGTPEAMQEHPHYDRPVLIEVYDWLEERIADAIAAGIARERIIVDPGIGFGKTLQHNLELINGLAMLHGLGCPVMLGASRKRTIGALANEAPADQRLGGSLALALKGAEQGVHLFRVHDVPETVQALRIWRGLRDTALIPPLG
jgi:dihydropteroate synthase